MLSRRRYYKKLKVLQDEEGKIRSQFILNAQQSKSGRTRTVYLNQPLRKALQEYSGDIRLANTQRPLSVIIQFKTESVLTLEGSSLICV